MNVLPGEQSQLKEYQKGYDLLRDMEKKTDSEGLQTALITFSLALKDEKGAFMHMDKLYSLNQRLAMQLAVRIVNNS